MNYRDKLDIVADILTVASQSAKRTQIMYQANLSYNVMRRYLDEVVAASLLSFEITEQRYMLTEKGRQFLESYREYAKSNKAVTKRLNDLESKKRHLENLCKGCNNSNSLAVAVI
jgi:predicted transcriptional regulator